MNSDSILRHYAEYHRRKWFPSRYKDPYGAYIDDVDEDTLSGLKATPGPAAGALMLVLLELLPRRRYPDLAKEVEQAYTRTIEPGILPSMAMYYLRALPPERQVTLWQSLKDWTRQSDTPLFEWAVQRTALERKLAPFRRDALARFGIDAEKECAALEPLLRASREIFDFNLRRYTSGRTLAEVLSAFRMPVCDALADWNDFPSFAHNWAETCRVMPLPSLKRSAEEAAEQRVFPVDPPSRVTLRFGTAAGPADTLRFLQELGRACFYCGMKPGLSPTERLLGDPVLPHFWASLYGGALTQPAGAARLIRVGAEDLVPRFELMLQFWNRYDCLAAIYRERLASDLKEAQDLYRACWDMCFAIEPPHFLYLFDLERSGESLLRVLASRSAAAVTERLRSLYGNDWFASERCARRLKEYRSEGYRLGLGDILQDLGTPAAENFLIPSS